MSWGRNKSDNPCFMCNRRAVGCHSNCKAYIDWRDAQDEKMKARAVRYEIDDALHKLEHHRLVNRKRKKGYA